MQEGGGGRFADFAGRWRSGAGVCIQPADGKHALSWGLGRDVAGMPLRHRGYGLPPSAACMFGQLWGDRCFTEYPSSAPQEAFIAIRRYTIGWLAFGTS